MSDITKTFINIIKQNFIFFVTTVLSLHYNVVNVVNVVTFLFSLNG